MRMLMPNCMRLGSPGAAPQLTPPSGLCFVRLNRGLSWGLAMIPPPRRIARANNKRLPPLIPDLQEEIRAAKQLVLEQEALLKRIRVIADKRGKHTTEEKKRLEAIKRWETKNSVTLLSDQSVQA